MNVGIICSSRKEIDPYYLSIARSISSYLAELGFDLVFGACSESMMGICYDEFRRKGRNITAVTTTKYIDDLVNMKYADPIVCDTTFDLKKELFENSDIIVALPGGIGTDSEILSFIEEVRSNDKKMHIEIYDEGNYGERFFEPLINNIIKEKINSKFADKSVLEYFDISHNKSEFKEHIDKFLYEQERNKRI